MKRDRGGLTGAVAKLLVRTTLSYFDKAHLAQHRYDLGWLQNRDIAHELRDGYGFNVHEFRLKHRLAIFEKHRNDFAQIGV